MKIAIIGCGYVGTAVSLYWKKEGHFLSGTTTKKEKVAALSTMLDKVYFLEEPKKQYQDILNSVDAILICVAPSRFSLEAYESTYLHTAKAIQEAAKEIPNPIQIIYTSSTSVYGEFKGAWVSEDAPYSDLPQAQILRNAEAQLESCRGAGHRVCIFRLGEITGPQREINNRLKKLNGTPLPGTGDNFTNIIHLEDIVQALDFALKHQLDGTYNLCNDLHISRKELYRYLAEKYHFPLPTWNSENPSIHGKNKRISNRKLKDLDFQFLHPLYVE